MRLSEVTNWNNYLESHSYVNEVTFQEDVVEYIKKTRSFITRGNGRCYGDASLSEHILSSLRLDKILHFDQENGIICAQSGVLLKDLLDLIIPSGWFLPVTPGTKYITLGGAIASNVHGKNHHKEGGFSQFVLDIDLATASGTVQNIKPTDDLFGLTCGSMGLTGVILNASIKLKPINNPWITCKTIKTKNLQDTMRVFDENIDSTYSMAWIDTLQKGKSIGRSLVMVGEHAEKGSTKMKKAHTFKMPFHLPHWTLNRASIKAFNFLYYHKQVRREQTKTIYFDPFFYPLDSILEWYKMYGRRGFLQYQFVIPLEQSLAGISEILTAVASRKFQSFLSVLKLMGPEDNEISFPMKGYTLALDFPFRDGLLDFLDELDQIVIRYGGRIYLSKDSRMSYATFQSTNPEWGDRKDSFLSADPSNKFKSLLSARLKIKDSDE